MLTPLTDNIELFIIFASICITIGAYKLITKQNSEQIKTLVDKFDNIRIDLKLDQAKMQSNFEHMGDTMNRIEKDTTIMREKTNDLSQAVGKLEVRLKSLEREASQ